MKNITFSTSFLLLFITLFGESPLSKESIIYDLPEFRVTGTLWERTIENTPESVTFFDDNSIRALNARSFNDLIENIPNLTFTGGTQSPRYFQIRGIGENSQFEGETPDQSVRFLIDDFDFTGIAGIANLFDVKQVEVIRGAQTSAYGVNASAGIIKIKTETPSLKAKNKFALGFGNYNAKNISYASGGLIGESDKTLYRLSVTQNISDGFIKNTELNLDNTNYNKSIFSLLKIKHKLAHECLLESSLIFTDANNGYDEWSLDNKRHETQSDKIGKDTQISTGLSLRYTSNNSQDASFTSVSSYLESDTLYSYDSDWGNFEENTSGYDGFLEINRDRVSFSQEFRLDSRPTHYEYYPIQWKIGLHFNHLNEISYMLYDETSSWGSELAEVYSDYQANSISLFGMFNFELNNDDNLSLGYRFENQSVKFRSKIKNENNYYGSLKEGFASSQDPLLGGALIYSRIISPTKKLFMSYKRGYRSAGANSSSFRQEDSPLIYKTENINSYEIGLNFNSIDSNFIGTLNLFHIERHNPQLRDSQGSGGFFNYFTSNAEGKAKHFGLEYQSIWNFTSAWSLSSSFSLLKARLDHPNKELSNSPSDQYSFILSYTPISGLYSNLSLAISDAYFESNSHNYKRDAYTVWKGSIGYKKRNFDISFWMNNIFDQSYNKRVFYFDNGDPDYPNTARPYSIKAAPAHYGFSVEYNW